MFKCIAANRSDLAAVAYELAQEAWDEWAKNNALEPIDHPEARANFTHETPGECADNLERLQGEGFRIPQHAIDALREEQSEMEAV
jgi:hypothetical protein